MFAELNIAYAVLFFAFKRNYQMKIHTELNYRKIQEQGGLANKGQFKTYDTLKILMCSTIIKKHLPITIDAPQSSILGAVLFLKMERFKIFKEMSKIIWQYW